MTQEEKAKAYDEALERARKVYNAILDNELLGFPGQIKEIFPILEESKDERIRKAIIGLVEELQRSEENFAGVGLTDMLAYLEKQKGKMTAEEFKSSELFQLKLKTKYANGYQDGLAQKPAQTEEEREYVRSLKALISDFIRDNYKTTDISFYQKIYDWLDGRHIEQKSAEYIPDSVKFDEGFKTGREVGFRECVESVKSAEWSDKDEKMRNKIIGHLSGFIYPNSLYEKDAKECIDWLKSLRPSWKPSEEQMEALRLSFEEAFNDAGDCNRYHQLKSLYEQLKKLGVKEELEYYQHFDPDC